MYRLDMIWHDDTLWYYFILDKVGINCRIILYLFFKN